MKLHAFSLLAILSLMNTLFADTKSAIEFSPLDQALPYENGMPVALLTSGEALQVRVSLQSSPNESPTKYQELTARFQVRQILSGRADYGKMGSQIAVGRNLKVFKTSEGEQVLSLKPVAEDRLAGTLSIMPPPGHYGLFEIEIQIFDKNGVQLGGHRVEYAVGSALPSNKSGNIAGFDAFNWRYISGDPQGSIPRPTQIEKRILKDYGFSWVHFLGEWDRVHLAPGNIQRLEILDEWIDVAREQGAKIIFMLADGAHAYEGQKPTGIPTLSNKASHWDMDHYREWAETIISRYKDKVAVWDVWNEPDSKEFAQAEDRDLQALKIVHELRDKYCPQSKVILSPHTHAGLNYLKHLLEKGAGAYLDGIGVHPYRGVAPETPEPDAFVGNPKGAATFLEEIEETHALLKQYGVNPPDVYITEVNYNLNYLSQYDELNQADMMVRMQILARTLNYVRSFINHAPCNGRLLLPTQPNLIAHLADTTFKKWTEVPERSLYAPQFEKSDETIIVPLWSIKGEKLLEISGLSGEPSLTDKFGNKISVSFDAENGRLGPLHVAQSTVFLTAPRGSNPVVSLLRLIDVKAPETATQGEKLTVSVAVRDFAQKSAKLSLQAFDGWSVNPTPDRTITASGSQEFEVSVPLDAQEGVYPIIASLTGADGRLLGVESVDVSVALPGAALREKLGIVVASDFTNEGLFGWTIQQGQSSIRLEDLGKERVVAFTQSGLDYAGILERQTSPVPYGVLTFDILPMTERQSFTVQFGDLRLTFDNQRGIGYYGKDGKWISFSKLVSKKALSVRILFSAPDGWFQVWLDGKSHGQFALPQHPKGFASLRVSTGVLMTAEKPTTFILKNIQVSQIEPSVFAEKTSALHWSICGPFPNRPDPKTQKRPFESDKDFLETVGGESGVVAIPGLKVRDPEGNVLEFTSFENPNTQYNSIPMFDFFMIKDLKLSQQQSDILCYAQAYVVSPKDQKAIFTISSDDGNALWVNSQPAGKFNPWPFGQSIGQREQKYPVQLRNGLNSLLLKVDQGNGGYGFYCKLESQKSNP